MPGTNIRRQRAIMSRAVEHTCVGIKRRQAASHNGAGVAENVNSQSVPV